MFIIFGCDKSGNACHKHDGEYVAVLQLSFGGKPGQRQKETIGYFPDLSDHYKFAAEILREKAVMRRDHGPRLASKIPL
jgi:hypothetical protein